MDQEIKEKLDGHDLNGIFKMIDDSKAFDSVIIILFKNIKDNRNLYLNILKQIVIRHGYYSEDHLVSAIINKDKELCDILKLNLKPLLCLDIKQDIENSNLSDDVKNFCSENLM